MAASASPAATMKLVGGDPCLDFVNSVGGRREAAGRSGERVRDDKLACYPDLVAFSAHAGLMPEAARRSLLRLAAAHPRAARETLVRALGFREALHRTLRAQLAGRRPSPEDLRLLSTEMSALRRNEALEAGAFGLRWAWRRPDRALDSPLWPIARAAAALVASGELGRLRRCAGEDCGWLFLDRSRNHSRRWCTMDDCGNVAKVRRFRERRLSRPAGAAAPGGPRR